MMDGESSYAKQTESWQQRFLRSQAQRLRANVENPSTAPTPG